MKLFCVPSHKSICPTPLKQQGVLVTEEVLKEGIWYPAGGFASRCEKELKQEFFLRRSENEPEYSAALRALLAIHNDDQHFVAVISMRWCSLTYRLVTAKRTWLAVYHSNQEVLAYNHKGDGRPTYNFCECWENPELDQKVWEGRFNEGIQVVLSPSPFSLV